MIPGVNIFSGKASVGSINRAGGSGGTLSPEPLRKILGSKEHLDWLKVDLNVAKVSTVQDSKCTKN